SGAVGQHDVAGSSQVPGLGVEIGLVAPETVREQDRRRRRAGGQVERRVQLDRTAVALRRAGNEPRHRVHTSRASDNDEDGQREDNRTGHDQGNHRAAATRAPQPGQFHSGSLRIRSVRAASLLWTISASVSWNTAIWAVSCGSVVARMRTASSPALRAPPIETVATGTPAGICTIDSSESSPVRWRSATGTPITGSVVIEATMPGRW